jgi:hypothetical protein
MITGVGITEARRKGGKEEEEQEPQEQPPPEQEPSGPAWQDVEDPTERLALALGLDPRCLAIYTGIPTTDA